MTAHNVLYTTLCRATGFALILSVGLALVTHVVPAQAGALEDALAGQAAQKRGEIDEAIRLFTLAVDAGGLSTRNQAFVHHNRGNAYLKKGQLDRAIQDYDQAIHLGPDQVNSFVNRGNAYCNKGQLDRAIQDYDQAIRLKPDYAEAFNNRGVAYRDNEQTDRAIQDYDQAIRLTPDYETALNNRGLAYVDKRQYELAAADFKKVWITSHNPYSALRLFLTRERSGGDGRAELAENVKVLDLNRWPGAVLSYYLGQESETTVLVAAKGTDTWTQESRVCEAFYYLGMARLLRDDRQGATDFFRRSVATGRTDVTEYREAKHELARLGAGQ